MQNLLTEDLVYNKYFKNIPFLGLCGIMPYVMVICIIFFRYHILGKLNWKAFYDHPIAPDKGTEMEGFIHLVTEEQQLTATVHHKGIMVN